MNGGAARRRLEAKGRPPEPSPLDRVANDQVPDEPLVRSRFASEVGSTAPATRVTLRATAPWRPRQGALVPDERKAIVLACAGKRPALSA